ncbi:MAG: AIM24 family protein [Betaproteobacteria bacterium]|nr:AIM24 family protein [Betaproteobacteria bacterium]
MSKYSIKDFIEKTAQRDASDELFELENPHLLEVKLAGRVWAKAGAMIGYTGQVKFKREGMLDRGLGGLLKKAVTGEGMTLMSVEGNGRVYFADKGKKVRVLHLQNETICVNGNDVLVLEDGLDYDITMLKSFGAMAAGGLFNVKISGTGHVAVTTHYEPITLVVKRGAPVFTDPNATVAWSGNLSPSIHTDVSFGTFIGRTSGESYQLKFEGEGWVVLQPYEESPVVHLPG